MTSLYDHRWLLVLGCLLASSASVSCSWQLAVSHHCPTIHRGQGYLRPVESVCGTRVIYVSRKRQVVPYQQPLIPATLQGNSSSNTPSPTLAPALLDLAHSLLTLAHSTLSRVQVLAAAAAVAVQPQLQQLAAAAADGPLAAAQQQITAVGSELLSTADVVQQQGLALRTALAAAAALTALQRAAAVEGLAAVATLRLAEVSVI